MIAGFATPFRVRPGVSGVRPLTEAYSSTRGVFPRHVASLLVCTGTPEVKAVREGDLATPLVWPP
jgi:hypothetical protein